MRSTPWLSLIRVASLAALAASGALVADYVGAQSPTYCGAGSGCATIRQAGWGHIPIPVIGYLPVAVVGAVAFALLLGVTLLQSPRLRERLSALGGIVAAVIAVVLILIQAFAIGTFCTLCLVVDSAAIAAGVGGVMLLVRPGASWQPLPTWAWASLGALAFLAPWYWPKARPAPAVPPEVQRLYVPGKINVVEFADFECPHCRRLHGTLKQLMQEYQGRAHLVRLNFPLASHPHAREAARAFVCADEQGQGEKMGDLLFETQLWSSRAQRRAAESMKLDIDRFDACVESKQTDTRIDRESQILRNAGFDGLPTTFVGSDKIIGAQPIEVFRAAFERAARGAGERGVPWPLYWLIALATAGGIVWFGRRGRRKRA